MALDYASLLTIPISYASCSLGPPSNPPPLLERLDAIAAAGFAAIELSFPDVLGFGATHLGHEVAPSDYDQLCVAAAEIKRQCQNRKLGIMMLQPFSNFEGCPEGTQERRDAFARARGWIKIMQAAGTDMLQVGSTDMPVSKLDLARIVPDLQDLADMLAEHGFKLAYENWCWSSHAPDWKDVWDIVQKVDRENVGLCLDTFQTAGGEWADPTKLSGLREDVPKSELEAQFHQSLDELSATIPKEKIYLLQISDAYKVPQPLSSDTDEQGLRPKGRWSHDFRPLPFSGGYLPVSDVTKAVLKTGFRGWFSYEVFDGGPDGRQENVDIVAYAMAARQVQDKLLVECAGGDAGNH